jgi:hypothetical protein
MLRSLTLPVLHRWSALDVFIAAYTWSFKDGKAACLEGKKGALNLIRTRAAHYSRRANRRCPIDGGAEIMCMSQIVMLYTRNAVEFMVSYNRYLMEITQLGFFKEWLKE